MKNNIKIIQGFTTAIALIFFATACSDYLDVSPEDKLLESQLYSTEAGFKSQLTGIYHKMVTKPLYGGQLTMTSVEVLAQRFTITEPENFYEPFITYSYSNETVMESFDALWSNAYILILNINDLLANIDKYNNVLNPEKTALVKGEIYGLRAMLHFDMLRLFGPIYSEDPESSAIPYYTKAQAENGPVLSANRVMELVLSDLSMAETLLENDPVIGIQHTGDDYFDLNRNLRFNYYAVKALQARANLYAGNTEEASNAAMEVIDKASSIFTWTDPVSVVSAGANGDRIFYPEVIFGPQNINLYDTYNSTFSGNLRASEVLYYNEERLEELFEYNENDYRYNPVWFRPGLGEITFKTFHKFANVLQDDLPFRYMQPLIRITEMYYILAETAPDDNTALQYLNTVRYNRGLVDLDEDVYIPEEITKEYLKEFYGEGQLFFYYKRINERWIIDANEIFPDFYIQMGVNEYVVPLPQSELRYQ